MKNINHYEANAEFRFIYSELKDHLTSLNSFLRHIHDFVTIAEDKLGKDCKIYSSDFFEYYYAGSYGETFRRSFIVSVSSVAEAYVKYFVNTWKDVLSIDAPDIQPRNGILEYLKSADKAIFELQIDFANPDVINFKGLLAIRNSLVHSSGNLDFVLKYTGIITSMARKYPSIKLTRDGSILTSEQFCMESLDIVKKFFYYIVKLSIRKFPNYRTDQTEEDE